MTKVVDEAKWYIENAAESMATLCRLKQVAAELDLEADYITLNPYAFGKERPSITLQFYQDNGVTAAFQLSVVEASEKAAALAKKILPKVGRVEKKFDDVSNEMKMVCTYQGVDVILKFGTPSTCTVEKVEEEVEVPEVPAVPAHTEKKVRYVLKGDCDPLMSKAATTEEEPVEEPVAVSTEEQAF